MPKAIIGSLLYMVIMLTAQTTSIAVIDFAGNNVPSADAKALTDRLRLELFMTGKFVVLEREKMDAILKEQQFQLTGCTSDACAVEVGQLLVVEQMVAGSVSKVGQTYSVTARLIDVEKGNLISGGKCDLKGDIGDVMTCLGTVAAQLAGISSSKLPQKLRSEDIPETKNFLPKSNNSPHTYKSPELQSSTPYVYGRVAKKPFNPFNILVGVSAVGFWTTYGLTFIGSAAVGDATFATTIIPVIGPFISIWVVEVKSRENEDVHFIKGGRELLLTSGYLQTGFALSYIVFKIGQTSYGASKKLTIVPNEHLNGFCLSCNF